MTPAEMRTIVKHVETTSGCRPYMICISLANRDELQLLHKALSSPHMELDGVRMYASTLDDDSFYYYRTRTDHSSANKSANLSISQVLLYVSATNRSIPSSPISPPGQILPPGNINSTRMSPGTGAFQGRILSADPDLFTGLEYDYTDGSGKQTCSHIWQQYNGLRESYQFCTKCDDKRTTEEGGAEDAKYKELYDTINNIWRPS